MDYGLGFPNLPWRQHEMILSDDGIRTALQRGDIEIDPAPQADQYTTSAVDLVLGAMTF